MVAARKRASTPSRAGGRTQLTLSHMHATNGRTEGRESGWVVLEENDTGSRANREGGEGLVTNFKNNAGLERARPGAVTARQDRPPGSTDNGRGTWGHMAQRVPYFLGEEQRFKSLGSCSVSQVVRVASGGEVARNWWPIAQSREPMMPRIDAGAGAKPQTLRI